MNRTEEMATIIEKIKTFHTEHGRSPKGSELPLEYLNCYHALRIRWNDLLIMAGLPVNKKLGMRIILPAPRKSTPVKEKVMIENLREAYALQAGYISNVSYDQLRETHERRKWYSAISIIKCFNTWKEALIAAGLPTRTLPKLKVLKERKNQLREALSFYDLVYIKGLEREFVFTRRFMDGESMAEIGKREGVSRQFVHVLIKRYLKRLEKTNGFLEKKNSNH